MRWGLAAALGGAAIVLTASPAEDRIKPEEKRRAKELVAEWLALAKNPKATLAALFEQKKKEIARKGHRGHDHDNHGTCARMVPPTYAQVRGRIVRELSRIRRAAAKPLSRMWRALPPSDGAEALKLLARSKSKRGIKALLIAVESKHDAIRVAAARGLFQYNRTHRAEVAKAYLRLLQRSGEQEDVLTRAMGMLGSLGVEQAWLPLLNLLASELARSQPRRGRLLALQNALPSLFRRKPSTAKVDDLFRFIGRFTEPAEAASRLVFLKVLADARAPISDRYLRYLLEQVYIKNPKELPHGPESEAIKSLFSVNGAADTLRPYSGGVRAVALSGLLRKRVKENFSIVLPALADRDAGVRKAALRAAAATGLPADQRLKLLRAVHRMLVDPARDLRPRAHAWLKQTTRQNLPLSFTKWRLWIEQEAKRVARAKDHADD